MIILAVLQCAWYRDGNPRRRECWQRDLWHSHTGRRLLEMIPEQSIVIPINASPDTGDHVHAVFPADPKHIRKWHRFYKPDVVLACGRVAQEGCIEANIPHVCASHPAWQRLKKDETRWVRELLESIRTK